MKLFNLNFGLSKIEDDLKTSEINHYRSKLVVLSQAITKNPHNRFRQLELQTTLQQLDRLLTA